jgi:predicted O-linked N-acetylglucosamine transferase (SPINDLY family)
MTLGRHAEAAESFARLARADPNFEHALGNRVHAMQQICAWDGLAELLGELGTRVRAGKPVATPWVMAAASDSAADQLRCAQMFTRDLYPPTANPLWRGERYAHDRIRVCYVSADFHDHATASLIAGLFEAHDRTRFEPIAISLGPDRQDGLRSRIESAFERFADMRTNSDAEIAGHIRRMEVDIAVDLKGFTRNCRPGIFARRPAPVQVSYLGYPGTMGAPYMDYIIADRHVIPADQQAFYAERVVYLPDSYQINDDKREISGGALTRAEAGLPESGFVFCCFNRSYKITPEVFDVWMRLLTKVPGSVLWLFEGFPAAAANLRAEAERRGVAPERLVFAPPQPLAEHLGRHRLADLFLDTVPCNAHTTASDALWAGLPVVTCLASTFAGRVAASLLHAVGLPELATASLDQYEALALKLAGDPALLAEVKAKLAGNLHTAPLFDTARACRNIEAAYTAMWQRQQRGDAPAGFSID